MLAENNHKSSLELITFVDQYKTNWLSHLKTNTQLTTFKSKTGFDNNIALVPTFQFEAHLFASAPNFEEHSVAGPLKFGYRSSRKLFIQIICYYLDPTGQVSGVALRFIQG